MKTQKFIMIVGILVLFIACSSDDDSPEPQPIEPLASSLFENDAEGWKIVGDAQGGYVEPSYSPEGGIIGGYIYAEDDVTGGVWYYAAPASYLGNKMEYYGATLSYSLFQDSNMSNQFENEDIIFRNGEKQICYAYGIDNYPGADWTPYAITIGTGQGWLKGEYDSGELASEEYIKEVLSNVTEFWIRGEFESGPDTGGMDKVIIE